MTTAKTMFERLLSLDLGACEVTVCLASSLKDEAQPRFEKLLLSTELTETFRSVAAYTQTHYSKEYEHHNLTLHSYALDSKPDTHEVEHLDISAYETIKEQIESLTTLADIETFQAGEQFIAGIRFYVIIAQPPNDEPICFFRAYSHKRMLGRSRFFAMIFSGGVYDQVRDPAFLFDHVIDCVSMNGKMFIFNKLHFQEMFRYFELVRKSAHETLEIIRVTVPIQNFDDFARDCESHLTKLVKLKKIASKPYWGKVTIENIKKVIEKNNLAVKIARVENKEMLVYDPSDKWVLLKLLDDDYLWSLMTEQTYEVTGKRELAEHEK